MSTAGDVVPQLAVPGIEVAVPGPRAPAGGRGPGLSVPLCCPGCGVVLERGRLDAAGRVCDCGWHLPLHPEAWVDLLTDPGSWDEHWAGLRPRDVLGWSRPKSYRATLEAHLAAGVNEAVRAGSCRIGGHPVWLAVFDFRFVGGTLGAVAGERLARAAERAAGERRPLVVVTSSGGARMQEGSWALLQMAKVNAAVAALHDAAVPHLTVLSHPTFGGTAASLALVADVILAEPGASVGFTGPRVIEQATHQRLPDNFQTAEFQLAHGQVDMIVPRPRLRATIADLLGILW
jgi:acetyl-CoA carboxylase carboxyl transferase beta subunit